MTSTELAPIAILGQIGPATTFRSVAIDIAQAHADRTQTPCGVWESCSGTACASEIPPDCDPTDTREADGWELVAVVDPW